MVKKLPLQTGEYALVDDEDYERCKGYTWIVSKSGDYSLVIYSRIDNQSQLLSRWVLQPKNDEIVLIINEDPFDCRKENLQVYDSSKKNIKQKSRGGTSKYKGVFWNKRTKRWHATIMVEGKSRYLGIFQWEDDAALAYNDAVKKYGVKGMFLNDIGVDNRKRPMEKKKRLKHRRNMNVTETRGVTKDGNKFRVEIKNGYVGVFECKKEAKRAYDQIAWDYWQEQAVLHYPENIPAYKEGKCRKDVTQCSNHTKN